MSERQILEDCGCSGCLMCGACSVCEPEAGCPDCNPRKVPNPGEVAGPIPKVAEQTPQGAAPFVFSLSDKPAPVAGPIKLTQVKKRGEDPRCSL
jgi:hypothetical protein